MTGSATRYDRAPAAYTPQADDYARHMEAARVALAAGDRDGAEIALRSAASAAEQDANGGAALAVALSRLGELCHNGGREDEAAALFERALDINERLLGPEHADLVVLLNDLSRLQLKRGAHAAAEPLLLRLHAIKRRKGEEHPEVATVLASLASVRQALGRYDSAEQLWRRVLDIRMRTLAPNHFTVATTLEHLGETCAARGKMGEALGLLQRALAMREQSLDAGHASLRSARERIADLQLQSSGEEIEGEALAIGHPAQPWLQSQVHAPATRELLPRPDVPPRPELHPKQELPARQELPPPRPVADEEDLSDDHAERELPDATGLRLVNVGAPGEAVRSLILPHYADAPALDDDEFDPDDQTAPSTFFGATWAFVRRRTTLIAVAVVVAGLSIGAFWARSAIGPAFGDAAFDRASGLGTATASAALPARPSPSVAESSIAAGVVEGQVDSDARPTGGPSQPDDRVAAAAESRSADGSRGREASGETVPSPAPPTPLHLRIDPAAPPAATTVAGLGTLAPTVRLPAGTDMRSAVPRGEGAAAAPALLIVAPTPAYPAELYGKGIGGEVSVEFVVDTTGRPVLSSFKARANHELFTESVRRIVPDMRFVPAVDGGRKTRAAVRMRFEFNPSGVISSRRI